jgi:hypothetical protein
MSSVTVEGFKSSPYFEQLKTGVAALPAAEKAAILKKVTCTSISLAIPCYIRVSLRNNEITGEWCV